MDFLEIKDVAEKYIKEIKSKENPQIIVLAIHAGLGDPDKDSKENPARFLASNLQGLDIVLASHDHQKGVEKVWNGKDSVLVMDGASRCEVLSKADISLELKNGKVISKSINGELIKMQEAPKDSVYLELFRDDFNKVRSFTKQKVGVLKNDMATSDAFFGPSDYMNMIHYTQMKATGADISFAAPLTVDKTVKKGDITFNEIGRAHV